MATTSSSSVTRRAEAAPCLATASKSPHVRIVDFLRPEAVIEIHRFISEEDVDDLQS